MPRRNYILVQWVREQIARREPRKAEENLQEKTKMGMLRWMTGIKRSEKVMTKT